MIGRTNAISGVSDPVPKIRTVSGSVISIFNALAMPAVSLVADINAVQNLNGYDHPWAGGAGKNILDPDNVEAGWFGTTDTTIRYGAAYRTISIPNLKAGTYTMSVWWNDTARPLRKYSDGSIETISVSNNNYTFTTTTDGLFMLCFRNTSSTEITTTPNISVVSGSFVPAAFEPYSNICPISGWSNVNVYREAQYDAGATPYATINLNGTVYGGSLDVTTGVLTATHKIFQIPDTGSWKISENAGQRALSSLGFPPSDMKYVPEGTPNRTIIRTSWCKTNALMPSPNGWAASASSNNSMFAVSYDDYIRLNIGVINPTSEQINKFIKDVGLQLYYPLATPQTVQLSPTTVQMLAGNNALWVDSGDSELQYWARR